MKALEALHQFIEECDQVAFEIARQRLAENPEFPHVNDCPRASGLRLLITPPAINGVVEMSGIMTAQCLDCCKIDQICW